VNAEVQFVRQDIATTKGKTVAELPNAKIVAPSQAQWE